MSTFHLEVKTADEAGAGTDSNIFIILYGELGQSTEERLNQHIQHNAFERNSTDALNLDDFPELGRIYKIRVRSDTHYLASDWRLSYIRIYPRFPDYPASTFRYEDWINDTNPREIYADDWPWPVQYNGTQNDSAVAQRISAFDLLNAAAPVNQEFTVTYELNNQVQVATDVKDTTKLATKVTWTSPETWLGKFGGEISAEWDKEVQSHRVDQSSQKLTTTDKRSLSFPAGKLTLILADWTELWLKAVATCGSTSVGMRWLQAIPADPSWTVANFGKGDSIPEPFASYLRANRPDLARLFLLPPEHPEPPAPSLPDRGSFSTTDIRPWDKPQAENTSLISFSQPFTSAPALPLGLTEIDIASMANIRIDAVAADVTNTNFRVSVNSWADTTLYSGGCAWLEIGPEDKDLQWSQFSTQEDHSWDRPQASTARQIAFPRAYAEVPQVVVWLNALDMSNSANWRVNAYATDISQAGFILHIDTWADSVLYAARASWVAYSSATSNIASGTFSTQEIRPGDHPQASNSKRINFSRDLGGVPRVTVALNSMDVDHSANLRLAVNATEVTPSGMTWHLDSWADTTLYSAAGAYVAQARTQP